MRWREGEKRIGWERGGREEGERVCVHSNICIL